MVVVGSPIESLERTASGMYGRMPELCCTKKGNRFKEAR